MKRILVLVSSVILSACTAFAQTGAQFTSTQGQQGAQTPAVSNDLNEAAQLNQTVVKREKLSGTESAAVVPALLNLIDLYFLQRNFETAHDTLGRALAILNKQPPHKDLSTAKRLRTYLCLLMGLSEAKGRELGNKVSKEVWRLEEPERAAEYEKEQKEKKERGESDKEIVGGGVLNGKAILKPPPSYPADAKRQGIMGTVIVQI